MEILPNENRDHRHGETTVSLGMHSQWRMSVLDQSMVESFQNVDTQHVRTVDLSDVGRRQLNNILKACPNVETLVLTCTSRLKHVKYALRCPKLRVVRLCLVENTILSLKDIPSQIIELTLQSCDVCDVGELRRFIRLEKLDLDQTRLRDGCDYLPQTLKHLNTRGSDFPWEKFSLPRLVSLHMAPAPHQWWLHLPPALRELHVEGLICDEGLLSLLSLPDLERVFLSASDDENMFAMDHVCVSESVENALRKKVKQVHITF